MDSNININNKTVKQAASLPIIALVGLCGTGKSEACTYLAAQGYTLIYFGGTVVEEVQRRGLSINPENERLVREELRKTYGMAAMAHINLPKINTLLSEGKAVAIDGLYSMGELDILRSELNERLQLLAIHAPKNLRYQRLKNRSIRPMTAQQVNERDTLEVLHLDKAGPIALADAHIVNDGDKNNLYAQLSKRFEELCII
jgi:dephospho-CoA kinase